ncbi:MAG: DUF1824 family protein [Pleurocapsa sp.]
MSTSQPPDLTLEQAVQILKSYDRAQLTNTESLIELKELRNSLLLIAKLSTSQNIGICADNFEQGFAALNNYLAAFGYQINLKKDNTAQISKPTYLKFSSQKMSYYSDQYIGEYRGVLISCQGEDDLITGTYGHFPLDLFS